MTDFMRDDHRFFLRGLTFCNVDDERGTVEEPVHPISSSCAGPVIRKLQVIELESSRAQHGGPAVTIRLEKRARVVLSSR